MGFLFLLEHYVKAVYCYTLKAKLRIICESGVEELKSLSQLSSAIVAKQLLCYPTCKVLSVYTHIFSPCQPCMSLHIILYPLLLTNTSTGKQKDHSKFQFISVEVLAD